MARQRLDHAASNLASALRHAGQRKRIDLSRTAPKLGTQLLTRKTTDLARRLAETGWRAGQATGRVLERRRAALDRVAAGLSPKALQSELRHARNELGPVAARLDPAFRRIVERQRQRLDAEAKLLNSVSYRNVLERGFAVVTDAQGNIVKRVGQVSAGDQVGILVTDGTLPAMIGEGAPPRRRPKASSDDEGQDSLF